MHTIKVRNVHQALPEAIRYIAGNGIKRDSRFGPVLQAPGPVTTVYERPRERVLFWPLRDANPFFHLMECIWMLAGRRDVEWLAQFNAGMRQFSDDGVTFNAAYGDRWMRYFHDPGGDRLNQLILIASRLRANRDDRRQVLSMWGPESDLAYQNTKDLPCNTHAYFQVSPSGPQLDMVVSCRSNDIIWGAYGANAVHLSFLHELLAASTRLNVGRYWQVSANWHAYEATLTPLLPLGDQAPDGFIRKEAKWDPYRDGEVRPFPVSSGESTLAAWLVQAERFCQLGAEATYEEPFFERVAKPVLSAWRAMKSYPAKPDRWVAAIDRVQACEATDWRRACTEWLQRRIDKHESGGGG